MKRSQLLTAMGLLTLAGIAIAAAGLLNLSQTPNYTFTLAWNELWEQHTLFAWTTSIYCLVMLAFDLWVITGILYLNPEKNLAN